MPSVMCVVAWRPKPPRWVGPAGTAGGVRRPSNKTVCRVRQLLENAAKTGPVDGATACLLGPPRPRRTTVAVRNHHTRSTPMNEELLGLQPTSDLNRREFVVTS